MKRLSNYIGIILVLALLGVLSYLVSTAYLKYSKQLENGTHSAAARLQRDQYSWAVLYPAIRKQKLRLKAALLHEWSRTGERCIV